MPERQEHQHSDGDPGDESGQAQRLARGRRDEEQHRGGRDTARSDDAAAAEWRWGVRLLDVAVEVTTLRPVQHEIGDDDR